MTISERLDLMLADAEPRSMLVLGNADWFAVRSKRAAGANDRGAALLMFRGCQVYGGADTRSIGPEAAAEWGFQG